MIRVDLAVYEKILARKAEIEREEKRVVALGDVVGEAFGIPVQRRLSSENQSTSTA